MKKKNYSLILPVIQIFAGCLAAIAFVRGVINNGSLFSLLVAIAIAIMGLSLGLSTITKHKKTEK